MLNYCKYDAWGNVTESGGVVTKDGVLLREANPFKYSGYQYDKETGFYYLKTRYYSPYLGRFITRDVISSTNEYVYAKNNSVNFIVSNDMLEVVDVREDIVQLPSEKVINAHSGEVLSGSKLAKIFTGNIKVSAKNILSAKPISKYTTSAIKKLPYIDKVGGKDFPLGPSYSLYGKVKTPMYIKGLQGANVAGIFSVIGKTLWCQAPRT